MSFAPSIVSLNYYLLQYSHPSQPQRTPSMIDAALCLRACSGWVLSMTTNSSYLVVISKYATNSKPSIRKISWNWLSRHWLWIEERATSDTWTWKIPISQSLVWGIGAGSHWWYHKVCIITRWSLPHFQDSFHTQTSLQFREHTHSLHTVTSPTVVNLPHSIILYTWCWGVGEKL